MCIKKSKCGKMAGPSKELQSQILSSCIVQIRIFKIIDNLNTDQIKCTLFTVPWNVVYVFYYQICLANEHLSFKLVYALRLLKWIFQHSVMSIV